VNCSRVKEIRRGALVLSDGTTLVTSRRRRAAVRIALGKASTYVDSSIVLTVHGNQAVE